MKAILASSLACSVASLLGLAGLSAVSVAPGGEAWCWGMFGAVGVFLAVWLRLAIWAGRRLRACPGPAALTPWMGRAVVFAGVVYVLMVLLCSLG